MYKSIGVTPSLEASCFSGLPALLSSFWVGCSSPFAQKLKSWLSTQGCWSKGDKGPSPGLPLGLCMVGVELNTTLFFLTSKALEGCSFMHFHRQGSLWGSSRGRPHPSMAGSSVLLCDKGCSHSCSSSPCLCLMVVF